MQLLFNRNPLQQLLLIAHSLMLPLLLLLFLTCCSDVTQAVSFSRLYSYRSSYSGSRVYSRYSASSMNKLVRNSFSYSAKRSALTYGIIFTSLRWRMRYGRHYTDDDSGSYDDSITFCVNYRDPLPEKYNSSINTPWLYRNRTVLGVFACPIGEFDDQVYCCGNQDRQRCCNFWDDASRVTILIVGLLCGVIFLAIFSCCCYCFLKSCEEQRRTSSNRNSQQINAANGPGQAGHAGTATCLLRFGSHSPGCDSPQFQ